MLLKNGFLVNPRTNTSHITDIRITDGQISELGSCLSPLENEQIIELDGLTVAPGLIDTHIHFRDPGLTYKEDLHTGALAAAKGGVTSVICMANTKPTVDSVETLKDILTRGAEEKIRIYQTAAVSQGLKGEIMNDFDALKAAGACGFTDDGIPLLDADFCSKAMEKAAQLNMPISLHEEDKSFITNNGINAGEVSEKLGIKGSPSIAEEVMVARDCMLALHTKAPVVIQHISSGNSVALVRLAKKLGADIHAEATPHHFTLTEEAVLTYGTLAKMNPPLRTEKDRLAIIEGLKDGTIDLIATDHAPHSEEEKNKPLTEAPSGITGLETSLGLGITNLVKIGHLTLMELLEKMTWNPAALYHLPSGSIEKGAPADLVIFDPDEKWTADTFLSKSSNTPFKGAELYGKIHYTICRGEVVYKG
ncbi:MAG: dihydroorotase [Blautia sp.]|uniref:dihydroorotase n=1 Tax=Blautia sp. TaxID=1955243 RepID=UPI002A765763|nr:dihydroorotase [Blautia sp.]MDY3018180.1 dihydroorotase [Blautia sp.]